MSNLYLFPCIPDIKSGYGIAVMSDIEHLNCSQDDYYIFIADSINIRIPFKKALVIYRNNIFFRIFNFLSNGHPAFYSSTFLFLFFWLKFRKRNFDFLFIGDINFYGLNNYFKYKSAKLRLHNVYLKIFDNLQGFRFDFEYAKMYYEAFVGSNVEKKIIRALRKRDIEMVCITEQEQRYLNTKFDLNIGLLKVNLKNHIKNTLTARAEFCWDKRIVWLGGLSSHKLICMKHFIETIYPDLKNSINGLKFELYGKGTDRFLSTENDICGYGFVQKLDLQKFSNSIFINPDCLGGGVKLKLLTFVQNNVRFLTTELGAEGFSREELGDFAVISDLSNWKNILLNISNC